MSADYDPNIPLSTLLKPYDIQPRTFHNYVAGIFSTFWVNLLTGQKPRLVGHTYEGSLRRGIADFAQEISRLCQKGGVPRVRPEYGYIRFEVADGQPCEGLQQAVAQAGVTEDIFRPFGQKSFVTELSPVTGLSTPELMLSPDALIERFINRWGQEVARKQWVRGFEVR